MKLRFLGTGGGRYVTGEQKRRTAGMIMTTEETRIHVDPGPGALVYTHQEMDNPIETEAVIVSHGHLDHSNDAEAIVEMMTETGNKPGAIFASESVLRGHGDIEKQVSDYHQDLCVDIKQLEDGLELEYNELEIRSQQMFHSDPKTQGFILSDDEHEVGFWTDTQYSDELTDFYSDCDVMVIYCTMPRDKSVASHTSLSDVPDIVERIDPKTAIITHFGHSFLNSDMEEQKQWLKDEADCKIIFAEDGMVFPGNRSLASF